MPGEKAWCEVLKNVACCFEQIMEAALHKTAAIWPFTSHLTNHPIKMSKTGWNCCRNKDELITNVGHTSVGQLAKIHVHQLCADTGCHFDEMPRGLADRDDWWERVKGIYAINRT